VTTLAVAAAFAVYVTGSLLYAAEFRRNR